MATRSILMHAPFTPVCGQDFVQAISPEFEMREDLLVDTALGAPRLQVGLEVLGKLVRLVLLLVHLAHLEDDVGGIGGLLVAVVLHEAVHIVDRLVELAKPDAERIGVAERGDGLLLSPGNLPANSS